MVREAFHLRSKRLTSADSPQGMKGLKLLPSRERNHNPVSIGASIGYKLNLPSFRKCPGPPSGGYPANANFYKRIILRIRHHFGICNYLWCAVTC